MMTTNSAQTIRRQLTRIATIGAAALTLLLSACGGGNGSSSAPPKYDVSGQWSVNETVQSASGICSGEVGESNSYSINIDQSGPNLTVTVSTLPGKVFHGRISGDNVSWTGNYPEDGGTVTFTGMSLRVDSPTTYTGTVRWRWNGGGESCTGSTYVHGSRSTPVQPYNGNNEDCGEYDGCGEYDDNNHYPPEERVRPNSGLSCYELHECLSACGDDACMDSCVSVSSEPEIRELVAVYECAKSCDWNEHCMERNCQAEFAACMN